MADSKSRRGPITAAEAIRGREERLRTDPAHRAQVDAIEAAAAERVRELREAQAPIVRELNAAGFPVSSIWDLANRTGKAPEEALPILLAHLERGGYPDRVVEGLGDLLAVKTSAVWWEDLKRLYLSARSPGEQDGVAVALAACAKKDHVDDLIAFLGIEERGDSRIYFVRPIKRLGGARGREVLEALRDDPTLRCEITAALAGRGRNE